MRGSGLPSWANDANTGSSLQPPLNGRTDQENLVELASQQRCRQMEPDLRLKPKQVLEDYDVASSVGGLVTLLETVQLEGPKTK